MQDEKVKLIKCTKCGIEKPESEYYPSNKRQCKDCWKLHFAELKAKKAKKENVTKK
jgi:hypothetical protein